MYPERDEKALIVTYPCPCDAGFALCIGFGVYLVWVLFLFYFCRRKKPKQDRKKAWFYSQSMWSAAPLSRACGKVVDNFPAGWGWGGQKGLLITAVFASL